jgi:hypothetical protein
MTLRVRLQNRREDGLGLAMPSGGVAIFEQVEGVRLLAGEADIGDKAEGERVDYDLGESTDLRMAVTPQREGGRQGWTIVLSNASPFDATAEVTIPHDITPRPEAMERRGDAWIWRVTVPANESARLTYSAREPR